jgi:hypothetical protein
VFFFAQPVTLTSHRLTTGVKCFAQDSLLRVHKLLPLTHNIFHCFTCETCQIPQIAFGSASIPTQVLTRLISSPWSQQ